VADSATLENQCHPRKIFIGGLAHKTTTQQLRDYFSRYGAIVDAVVLRWPDGRSRGFGYVTFSEAGAAAAALRVSHQVGGRQIDVKRAVPGTNKLFVGGLPQNTAATELREHFEVFGVVSDAVVMIDPVTGRSRGFGFVCFLPGQEGAAAVAAALDQYDNHRLRGKWIEVKSAASPHKLAAKESARPQEAGPAAEAIPAGLVAKDWMAPSGTCPTAADGRRQVAMGPMTDERPVASPTRRRGQQKTRQAPGEPRKVALPSVAAMGTPPGLTPPRSGTESPPEAAHNEPAIPMFQAPWPPAAAAGQLSLANALGVPGAAIAPGLMPHCEASIGQWSGAGAAACGGLFATSYSLVKSLEQLLKQQSLAAASEKVGAEPMVCAAGAQ